MPGENRELLHLRKEEKDKRDERMKLKDMYSSINIKLNETMDDVDTNLDTESESNDDEPSSYQDLLNITESQKQEIMQLKNKINDLEQQLLSIKPQLVDLT